MSDLGKCTDDKHSSTEPAKGILVVGDPGIGKSTFAWKCCQKWANEEILQDWSIVIFIQLSNQCVREAQSLSDFIYYPEKTVRKRICRDLATEGKQVLFVIDSFDQVNEQQISDSVFQQLVDKELLPNATLMVLSRPVKSWRDNKLKTLASKLGINKQIVISGVNVDHYFKSACSGDLLVALESLYLSNSHPLIYSQMNIPVHSAMIASLFRLHWNHGDKEYSPNTLTEFYTDLVCALLVQYLSNHHKYGYGQMELPIIEKFTDLPGKSKDSFMAIAHLAAKGIEESKYVFDLPKDFETLEFKTVDFETFGLIQKVEDAYPDDTVRTMTTSSDTSSSVSYRFLHLSLQEYLAAYYYSQLEKPSQILQDALKPHAYEIDSSLSKYDHCTVVLFTVGLSKSKHRNQ